MRAREVAGERGDRALRAAGDERSHAVGHVEPVALEPEVGERHERLAEGRDADRIEPEPLRQLVGTGRLGGQRIEDPEPDRGDHRPAGEGQHERVVEGVRRPAQAARIGHRLSLWSVASQAGIPQSGPEKRHRYDRRSMAYVIAEPCIGQKDNSCVEVCPVDCIHPTPDEPDYENVEQLYIDPDECIDCDACVEACPVDACFAEDQLPEEWQKYTEINVQYFQKQ